MRRLLALLLAACIAGIAVPASAANGGTVVFVVDESGSMQGQPITATKSALRTLVADLPAATQIGIVGFSDRAVRRLALTQDRAAAARAINALTANGDTALYDAIAMALGMAGTDGAIVVMSDGADTTSKASLNGTVKALQPTAVELSVVGFRTNALQREVLRTLAAARGGELVEVSNAAQIERALRSALIAVEVVPTATPTPTPTVSLLAAPAPVRAPAGIAWPVVALLLCLTFGGLATVLYLAISDVDARDRRRIRQLLAELPGSPLAATQRASLYARLRAALLAWTENSARGKRLVLRLDAAGIPIPADEWVLMHVGGVVLLMVLTLALGVPLLSIPAAALGAVAPLGVLAQRAKSRRAKFNAGLPDLLLLVASSLRAGFSVEHSIATACDRAENQVGVEFNRAVREMRLGGTLEDALERMAARTGSRDVEWIVSALRIQRKTGGNLSQLLQTAAQTVRERTQISREVAALTAEGRMSANVLIALPITLGLFMQLTRPDYMAPMWNTLIGRGLFALAVGMVVTGYFILRKLVQVEV